MSLFDCKMKTEMKELMCYWCKYCCFHQQRYSEHCLMCSLHKPQKLLSDTVKTPKLLSFMLFKFLRILPKWVGIYKKHCTPGTLTVFFLSFQPYHQVEVPQFSSKSEPSVFRWLHPTCVTSPPPSEQTHSTEEEIWLKASEDAAKWTLVENIFVKLLWFHVENQLSRWV